MAELLSHRAGAAALGMALSTFQHHVKRGNITLVEGKVDVDLARAQLARRRDADQSIRGRQNAGGRDPSGAARADSNGGELWREKERVERIRGDLLEIELATARSELVERVAVEQAMATKLTGARDVLLGLADRLAPLLAAETDALKIAQLLGAEIRVAMRAISAEAPAGES